MENVIKLPVSESIEIGKVLFTASGQPFARITSLDFTEVDDIVEIQVLIGKSLREELEQQGAVE